MGHEASGQIAEVGTDVSDWYVGDRVTFDSTIYRLDDWYTRKGLYNLSDGREVVGVSPGEYRRNGAFAEYVAFLVMCYIKCGSSLLHSSCNGRTSWYCSTRCSNYSYYRCDTAVVVGAGMIGSFIVQALKVASCGKSWLLIWSKIVSI